MAFILTNANSIRYYIIILTLIELLIFVTPIVSFSSASTLKNQNVSSSRDVLTRGANGTSKGRNKRDSSTSACSVDSDTAIVMPKKFKQYFNYVANEIARRGNLNEEQWRMEKINETLRKRNFAQLDRELSSKLKKVNLSKGRDFLDKDQYTSSNETWYNHSTSFGQLAQLMQRTFVRAYMADKADSRYARTDSIKEIIDHFVRSVNGRLTWPLDNFKFPWGDNWYQFSVTYPTFLFVWTVARHSNKSQSTAKKYSITHGSSQNYEFSIKSCEKDDVDVAALTYFKNLYEYPIKNITRDNEKNKKCGSDGCGIKSIGWLRQGSNTILMGLPWTIGKIFWTMLNDPTKLQEVYHSFGLSDEDENKAQEVIPTDYIAKYLLKQVRVAYATLFNDEGIFGDGSFIYHTTVPAYGYLTSSYSQNQALNHLFENHKGVQTTTDRVYEKYIFSKLEHPKLQNHVNFLFSRGSGRSSEFKHLGQIGAFVMHRIGLVAFKGLDWSLVFRCQRPDVAFYESDKTENKVVETWIMSREFIDNDTSSVIDRDSLGYKLGVVRLNDINNVPIFTTRTSTTSDWLPEKPGNWCISSNGNPSIIKPISAIVHINDNPNKSALASIQAYSIRAEGEKNVGIRLDNGQIKPFSLINVEFNLITPRGLHVIRATDYRFVGSRGVGSGGSGTGSEKIFLGLGHTYNPNQRIRILMERNCVQIGNNLIYMNSGVLGNFVIRIFKDSNGKVQRGVYVPVDPTQYSFSCLRLTSEDMKKIDKNEIIGNELTSTPSLNVKFSWKSDNSTREDYTKRVLVIDHVAARLELLDYIANYRQELIELYDRSSHTLKLSKYYEADSDDKIPTHFMLNRSRLRNLIGNETIEKYRVRSTTNAQYWQNYDLESEREVAKLRDSAILDNPKATLEDANVNYKVAINNSERYPDVSLDNLSTKQRLQEYDRSCYEVRVDGVKNFANQAYSMK